MKLSNLIVAFILINLLSCKKYEYKKNVLIRINVINVYTAKGFKDCKVFFRAFKKGKYSFSKGENLDNKEFFTDENGNISFLYDIDFNPRVEYEIGVKSISERYKSLDGISGIVDKNTIETDVFNIGVSPYFYKLLVLAPCPTINDNIDSFKIRYFNRTALIIAPNQFNSFLYGSKGFSSSTISLNGLYCKCYPHTNYSSGTWTFETERWKNGQYSKVVDSLFIDYADSVAYQIPW